MNDKSCQIFNIFALLKKLGALNKERVGQFGLNHYEVFILYDIYENKLISQKDLVEKLKAPKQTINSIVMSLKERDLLTMVSDENDKRQKNMTLTDKGKEEIDKISSYLSKSDGEIYNYLGKDKIREIENNLNELIEALETNINKEGIWTD